MAINPAAGQPAQPSNLVNVPRLVTALFRGSSRSENSRAARYLRNLGPSRFVASIAPSTSGTSWRSRRPFARIGKEKGIDGPLFLGIDTHALSEPAFASAMEVLAANEVHVRIAPTGRVHAHAGRLPRHSQFQSRQKNGVGRWHRGHAFAQSARGWRLQVQSAARRTGRQRRHRLHSDARQ